jgi:cytochrome P450 / NADPH-cytochrome P450 reductase
MQDIVSQMVVKWARFGGDTPIDASEDFTKLTLDSIAL